MNVTLKDIVPPRNSIWALIILPPLTNATDDWTACRAGTGCTTAAEDPTGGEPTALSDKPEPAYEGCRSEAVRPPADATRPGRRNGSV